MEEHPVLRPGQQTDVVVEVNESNESIDVRQSIIYDILGQQVTVAQTTRPVAHHDVQRKVIITVLSRKEDRPVRWAVPARVAEVLRDYRLASDKSVGAVNLDIVGKHYEYNLRMHYRVRPALDSGLDLIIGGTRQSVLDISIGGAKILLDEGVTFTPGSIMEGKVRIDGRDHDVRMRALRRWEQSPSPSARRSDYLVFGTLQFVALAKDTERHLSQKIREVERILRQQELDMKREGDRGEVQP